MKDKRCECFSNAFECPENDCEGCPARLKSEAEIRAEAIEEFAERLKRRYPIASNGLEMAIINSGLHKNIDEVAKELKGE